MLRVLITIIFIHILALKVISAPKQQDTIYSCPVRFHDITEKPSDYLPWFIQIFRIPSLVKHQQNNRIYLFEDKIVNVDLIDGKQTSIELRRIERIKIITKSSKKQLTLYIELDIQRAKESTFDPSQSKNRYYLTFAYDAFNQLLDGLQKTNAPNSLKNIDISKKDWQVIK